MSMSMSMSMSLSSYKIFIGTETHPMVHVFLCCKSILASILDSSSPSPPIPKFTA